MGLRPSPAKKRFAHLTFFFLLRVDDMLSTLFIIIFLIKQTIHRLLA
jgi:hypothetical protein